MSRPVVEVHIAAPPADPGEEVRLFGELSDWVSGVAIGAEGVRLRLPTGVFSYKLKVGGRWTLDPENPRTRTGVDGARNNVLSVGGAPEPLLFAPAPPMVIREDRGGITVNAALRRGAGDRLFVRWCDTLPGGLPDVLERTAPMRVSFDEPEHRVFQVRLPVVPARLRFALEDGTLLGPEQGAEHFAVGPEPLGDPLPRWWREAVVYTVFVDRFRPAHDRRDWVRPRGAERAGGHLEGVRRSLPELRELGVNTLYLTPVQLAASSHRYDLVDPLVIDPALGGRPAFEALVEEAHRLDIRVLLDFSFSHAGRGFPAYEDVLAQGPGASRAGWFVWKNGVLVHYGTRSDAPLLNLEHPEVRALVHRTAEHAAGLGIDGLRLDGAAEVPIALAREVRAIVRRANPEAIVLGELVPAHAHRWIGQGAIDVATDFAAHRAWTSWLSLGQGDARDLARDLAAGALARGTSGARRVQFLSTHDLPRFATLAALSGARGRGDLGWLTLLTAPGVPMLLYGEEHGLRASETRGPEGVWPDRMPMPFPETAPGRDPGRRDRVRTVLALRASHPELRIGEVEVLAAEGALFGVRRRAGREICDVVINRGEEALVCPLPCRSHPEGELLFAEGHAALVGSSLELGPRSGAVVKRQGVKRGPGARLAQRRRCDEAFRRGELRPAFPPTRVDFGVTEQCNLRCPHCLAFAPDRTASGTARTMSPWLLDRIRDDLGAVSYSCVGDLGEALTTPMLFEVLDALRGTPMIHLLTNGLLLDAAMGVRLAAAGVRSIQVSLDGGTAAIHDGMRGGGFDRVVANLRSLLSARRERSLELRLGISAVVAARNVGQLSDLVRLSASLGVDWVKFEEPVPVNGFAPGREALPEPGRVAEEVERALMLGRALGLVTIDHVRLRSPFRCEIEAGSDDARFVEDDAFACHNAALPCRTAWEHVSVAANGDVKLGDLFGVLLGNLAEQTLDELWRGPVACSERTRAVLERPCRSDPRRISHCPGFA